jgi:hypothetical protein
MNIPNLGHAVAEASSYPAMDEPAGPAPWLLLVLAGAVCLIQGYRMVRFSSKLGSALFAIALGLTAGQHLHNGWVVAAILAGAGIAGWRLGNAYYFVNMALVGALMGVIVMFLGARMIGGTIEWTSALASAVLGAMLSVRFERPLVILGSSISGAAMLVQAGHPDPSWGAAGLIVCLTLLGCLYQARRTRPLPATRPVPGGP